MSQRLHTFVEFFRAYGTRKKEDLLSPRFHNVADIVLPRDSLIHYTTHNEQAEGPAYPEMFISNYPKDVYIDFRFNFTPILGKGMPVPFVPGPVIKFYKNKFYQYKWARDTGFVYRQSNNLVVQNHALAMRNWRYTANLFMNFNKSYNFWNMIVKSVNDAGKDYTDRNQFLRIDLPVNMPGFKGLMDDTRRYVKTFKDGLPVVDNSIIRHTKAENCFWLMDLLLFIEGDKDHNVFAKIDRQAANNINILLCSNSRVWLINLGLLITWLEPIQKKPERIVNAVKRFYLNLINLVNGSRTTAVLEEDHEKPVDQELATGEGDTSDDSTGKDKEQRGSINQGQAGEDESEEADLAHVDIVDLFRSSKKDGAVASGAAGDAGSQNDAGSTEEIPGGEAGSEAGAGGDNSDGNSEEALNWLSPVNDFLLEPAVVAETIATVKDVFTKPESGILLTLEEMAKEGSLTVRQKQFYAEKAMAYKTIGMPNGQSLEEFIKIDPEDLKNIGGEIKGNFKTIQDPTMLRQRVVALRNDYPKKFLHKDLAAAVLNIQNAGIILSDYQIDQVADIEGEYQILKFQLMPVRGKVKTQQVIIPAIDENGEFLVDDVRQYSQFQRIEFPIRKITERHVVLTSHYDKKVNITRSDLEADNYNNWLVRQIVIQSQLKKLTISTANLIDRSVVMPRYVTMLARKFRIIEVNNQQPHSLVFNFDTLGILKEHPEWKSLCKADSWVVGIYAGKPMIINNSGIVSIVGGSTLGTFEELVGVDMTKSPLEYAVVNIGGFQYPAGVVLCYYFGIDKLLKVLKSEYRTIPAGQRYKLFPDEYSLKFNDEQLIFNKRDALSRLVFGGISKLDNTVNFSRGDLNTAGVWVPLMGNPKVRPQHFTEMRNMFNLFIDPITKERLKGAGYSTSFHYLIIDAMKMLLTDNTRHEVEIEEQLIIGYERIVSHVYSEMCKSNRQFSNKSDTGNQTFDLNPNVVITNIVTDSANAMIKEMNPFHPAKSQEDITFGGFKGRDATTMLKRTRSNLKSADGIISEAAKDNGKVGFVGYVTQDPRIGSFRGEIDTKSTSEASQLFSSIGNLKYGSTLDSPQRTSYASIQASHAVSARNYTPNIIRTGQDVLLAHRLSESSAKVAKQAGKVIAITEDTLLVEYEDGTRDSCLLGLKLGKSDGELYRHTLITDQVVGSTFDVGDVLMWDDEWFAKDVYNPGQVTVKTGRMTTAVFKEDQTVYEDSMEFWTGLAEEFVTPMPKGFTFFINADETIKLRRKVGDAVEFDTILCEILDSYVDNFESDDDVLNEINRAGIRQIKSNHDGKVISIEVAYNAMEEEMSDSVRKLVREYDKKRKDRVTLTGKGVASNRVGAGFNLKRPSIPYGRIKITIVVEFMSSANISDKFVFGNQMKGTLGCIVPKQMQTEDGRKVPFKFSFKSLFKRMVISLRNKAVVNEWSYAVKDEFIKLARGK